MPVLNIKNFPKGLYQKLRKRAEKEHRSIAQEVIHILSRTLEEGPMHSLEELHGLGKECWEGIDPAEYIRQERDSWGS